MNPSRPMWYAFVREVARSKKAWTVRDSGGVPAPSAPGGQRVVPFWSSRERVDRILAKDPEFAGFDAVELTWELLRDKWLSRLEREGWLAGLNWSGDRALGFDVPPKEVREKIEEELSAPDGRVVVETLRLQLREWVPDDASRVGHIYGDRGTTQFIGDGRPRGPKEWAAEIERCRRLYRERGYGLWAMIHRESRRIIGHCGLQDLDGGDKAAIGYALAREWRGAGYAIEAARAVVRYGFEVLELPEIYAVMQPSNVESIKQAVRLGMDRVGEETHYGKRVLVYVIRPPRI